MISTIKKVYRNCVPETIRELVIKVIISPAKKLNVSRRMKLNKLKNEIIQYYEQKGAISEEQQSVINYLKNNPLAMFPFKVYEEEICKVYHDSSKNLRYVFYQGKRLYMKRSMTRLEIQRSYGSLLCEQHVSSPHCYFSDDFFVEEGDIVVDAGTAEGNFALSIVEKAKKVYLFETDPEWIEVLEATFEPWKEKVVILNKFVSDNDEGQNITLDTVIGDGPVDFIKADIEGAEVDMVKGMKQILSRPSGLKIVLCTYHHQSDEKVLSEILTENGFTARPSKGYMILLDDPELHAPYLRRGLLRAKK